MLYDRLATAIKLVCCGGFPGISLRQPKKQTHYQHQEQRKKDASALAKIVNSDGCGVRPTPELERFRGCGEPI
jgi:hypothetical protein